MQVERKKGHFTPALLDHIAGKGEITHVKLFCKVGTEVPIGFLTLCYMHL
jgi:hypothetical protein